MMRVLSFLVVWVAAVTLVPLAQAQPGSPDGLTYKTSWSTVVRFGMDLHKNLKKEYQPKVHVKPINVETDVTPFIRLEEIKSPELPNPMATVFISAGFIDLVNNVAHAKAIDKNLKDQKGYFQRYILSLAAETGEKELRELPNLSDKRFWTLDMMNEQLSNFNQIVGVVVGIKLAHYYLGHYAKYASKLTDSNGNPVPINTLLTDKEWNDALRCGEVNALNCGLGIDGVKALYECIDKMPKRPSWTLYFLPEKAKVSSMLKEMTSIERRFLKGEQL